MFCRESVQRPYRIEVVDGIQAVNGRIVDNVLNTKDRTCTISDPCDREQLARRSFDAGAVAQQIDQTAAPVDAVEIIDESAVVHHGDAIWQSRFGRCR